MKARERERERKEDRIGNVLLQNLSPKMANHRFISLPYYDPIVEIHRGREKHARSAASRACLWLRLISGFVCVAVGSSCRFAADPQALCVIIGSGFLLFA